MSDLSNMYDGLNAKSDHAYMKQLGNFVKTVRLEQNITQGEVAEKAGISRSTLSLLEKGETFTIATLIQVLRVLNRLDVFSVFTTEEKISPLALAKAEKYKRKRARSEGGSTNSEESSW